VHDVSSLSQHTAREYFLYCRHLWALSDRPYPMKETHENIHTWKLEAERKMYGRVYLFNLIHALGLMIYFVSLSKTIMDALVDLLSEGLRRVNISS